MGDVKCTFGIQPPLDVTILNEYIYREVKHFRNYTTYTPNFRSVPVTTKFYAAHDYVMDSDEHARKIDKYEREVTQNRCKGPHSKNPTPATENQVYGWYETFETLDRSDARFYNPKRETSNTKTQIRILMALPKKKK